MFFTVRRFTGAVKGMRAGDRECGVVFSVTRSGRERVLYRFNGYSDGRGPNSLIWLNNELYGTTNSGGVEDELRTIFSLTRSGMKATLPLQRRVKRQAGWL